MSKEQDGIKQHDEAHSNENTAFGMAQVRIDERKDGLGSLCLTSKAISELVFQQVGKAESAGDGEKKSKDRDDCQECTVG